LQNILKEIERVRKEIDTQRASYQPSSMHADALKLELTRLYKLYTDLSTSR
jgi:hypothetical protein